MKSKRKVKMTEIEENCRIKRMKKNIEAENGLNEKERKYKNRKRERETEREFSKWSGQKLFRRLFLFT